MHSRPGPRDALLAAMIGDPSPPLPAFGELDLDRFWREFEEAAPRHLRVGLRAATISIAVLLPRLMGHRRGLAGLDADAADAVIQRAAVLPGLAALAELAKLVACFAYFADDGVQAAARDHA